ncbi:MAG: NUDIX hydrolase [Desulfurococcaceae archaeon]|jgi:ADP-ribose pyrophosphatase|nr:NUDIX hydrolase [Desulfurococcaceae archaeon]
MFGGVVFTKDVVRFGQAVAIIPIIGDEVILIKQFRPSLNKWVLEVPAGRVEVNEALEDTAKRELIEEVGYDAKTLIKLVSIYPAPGYSDEVLHIFLAKDLTYVGSKLEVGELIEVVKVKLDSALDLILSDDVVDAKTLISLLILKLKTPELGLLPK